MIGAIAIVCGLTIAYLLTMKGESSTRFLHPGRRREAMIIAIALIALGGAEFFVPAAAALLGVRLAIGIVSLGIAWVVPIGVVQSTSMIMGCLIAVRAALLYFGLNP